MTEFREAKPIRRGFDRLTPLDEACKALLDICHTSPCLEKPLTQAVGLIAAKTIISPAPIPSNAVALRDGFAVRAIETIGASAYTPAFAISAPQWIAAGDRTPLLADAILPAYAVQEKTLPIEILAQAAPGESIRFQGDDFRANVVIVAAGERIKPLHAALLSAYGMNIIGVCTPRVAFLLRDDLPQADFTGECLFQLAKALGASCEIIAVDMSDVASFSERLAQIDADLIVSIGGTGFGDTDHAADALQKAGSLLVHGLAMRPGETGGCGFIAGTPHRHPIPVILAPGRLEAAFAIWLSLIQPCLSEMMAIAPQRLTNPLPLSRKITSNPGIADIVLLRHITIDAKSFLEPLASGDLPWHALAQAEAWHMIPPESEGYPAGHVMCAEEI